MVLCGFVVGSFIPEWYLILWMNHKLFFHSPNGGEEVFMLFPVLGSYKEIMCLFTIYWIPRITNSLTLKLGHWWEKWDLELKMETSVEHSQNWETPPGLSFPCQWKQLCLVCLKRLKSSGQKRHTGNICKWFCTNVVLKITTTTKRWNTSVLHDWAWSFVEP